VAGEPGVGSPPACADPAGRNEVKKMQASSSNMGIRIAVCATSSRRSSSRTASGLSRIRPRFPERTGRAGHRTPPARALPLRSASYSRTGARMASEVCRRMPSARWSSFSETGGSCSAIYGGTVASSNGRVRSMNSGVIPGPGTSRLFPATRKSRTCWHARSVAR